MPALNVDVSELDQVGKYKLLTDDPFRDVFICRISLPDPLPEGILRIEGTPDCLVAFSRLCTHLGCNLVDGEHKSTGQLPVYAEGGVQCGCQCHLSSFDLSKEGIPINAPATACLPGLKLERVNATSVNIVGWIAETDNASVPYGVPYRMTLANIRSNNNGD